MGYFTCQNGIRKGEGLDPNGVEPPCIKLCRVCPPNRLQVLSVVSVLYMKVSIYIFRVFWTIIRTVNKGCNSSHLLGLSMVYGPLLLSVNLPVVHKTHL